MTTSNIAGLQSRTSTVVRQPTIDGDTWLLDQYGETRVQEGSGEDLKLSEACWDNGFMTRQRTFRGLTDAPDYLTVFTPDGQGNVAGESRHAVAAIFDTCSEDPGSAVVATENTWLYGSLESSKFVGFSYKTTDLRIDPSTGLAEESRDSSGRTTRYEYDVLGRLTRAQPPEAAESRYDYFRNALETRVVARQVDPSAPETSLTESHYHYDGLGRLIQEKQRMPAGWATVNHTYDTSGRKASVTVPRYELTPAYSAGTQGPVTSYLYDVLGRMTRTVAPDGNAVDTTYTGDREVSRAFKVATTPGNTTEQSEFSTKEIRDGFGRLIEVREPLPGGEASTTYGYDVGDRLISVTNGQEQRTFSYDRSGLLLADNHPESEPSQYTYDTAGRLSVKQTGERVSLLHNYDAANRLTEVKDQGAGRVLKEFKFDSEGVVSEPGKLIRQTRHNYFTGATYTVSDRFEYDPDSGRLAWKKTEVITPTGTTATSQQYTYDDVGQPDFIRFPQCSQCGGFPLGGRQLALNWSDGLLRSVAGAANSIEYAPSGVVNRIVHATGPVDVYELDLTEARPARIKFTNVRDCAPILRQPAGPGSMIDEGLTATFSLEAAPGATIQWYEGIAGDTRTPISNAVSPTFQSPALYATTNYWARVTAPGGGCDQDSLTVTAVVCKAPVVLTPETTSATRAVVGVPMTFSVDVAGVVTYKWFTRIGSAGELSEPIGNGPQITYTPLTAENALQIVVEVETQCSTVLYKVRRVVAILDFSANPCAAEFDPVFTNIFPWTYTILLNETSEQIARLKTIEDTYAKRRYSFRWYQDGVLTQSNDAIWPAPLDLPDPTLSKYLFRFVNQSHLRVEAWVSCYNSINDDEQTPAAVSERISRQTFGVMNGHCPTPDVSVSQTDVLLGETGTALLKAESVYPDPRYQWYEGESGNTIQEVEVNGTAATLTVSSEGTYWVRVSSTCGAYRDSATITVSSGACHPVRILRDPVGGSVAAGTPVTLSVDAAAVPSPSYYLWAEAGNGPPGTLGRNVEGSNGKQSITVVPLETTDYYVRVGNRVVNTNDCSLVNSRIARVRVISCTEINIIQQPDDVQFSDTDVSTTLRIDATTNSGTLKYKWFMGESGDMSRPVDPSIGSGPVLQLTYAEHLQDPATNRFWVKVSFDTPAGAPRRCAVDSRTATICRLPRVHNPIGDYNNAIPRQRRVIEIGATGDELTYEWFEGPDETRALSSKSSAVVVWPETTTEYWVKIRSNCAPANVWKKQTSHVSVCPAFTGAPSTDKAKVTLNTTTTLRADVARGDTVTWYKLSADGAQTLIDGMTGAVATTPPITATTQFFARAKSGTCHQDSEPVTVELCDGPEVSFSSSLQLFVKKNTEQTLTATARPSDGALTWEWYRGGNAPGDLVNSVPVSNTGNTMVVYPTQTETYWVRGTKSPSGCYDDSPMLTLNVCVPTILTQPQSTMIDSGATARLTVTTDNLAGVTYQWYAGLSGDTSMNLNGQTSNVLDISPSSDTSYWVRATGCSNTLWQDSQTATVSLCRPVVITTQPASSWHTTQSTTLSVTATGTDLAYQWYKGLSGDTSAPQPSTSAILVVNPQQTTNYWVRVSGRCGAAQNSTTAKVSVSPSITAQPAGGPITKGTTRALAVTANGAELAYQWYQRPAVGSPAVIGGATGSSYTPPPILADTTYFVRVYSGQAFRDSADATLTVCLAREINIVGTPSGHSGAQVALQVQNPGAGETFEWYRGPVGNVSDPLGGGTLMYVTPSVTTQYWVRTKRSGCDADSAAVTIHVCYPAINTQPEASSMIPSGTTKTLSVSVTGTAPLVYQWYRGASGNTSSPVGTSSNVFTTPALTASTQYWVRISTNATACAAKFVDSQTATVNVCQPPVITVQPQAQIVPKNLAYTLSVTATGDGLHYQWYIGESGVTTTPVGTDSNQLPVTAGTTKKYWVRVTGTCGVVNSVAALQSVIPTITAHPATANVCGLGGTATFSVTSSGADGYKWYRTTNSVQELVGTAQTLTIAVPNAAASFRVVVTSGDASTTSQSAGVTILAVPTVTAFTATQETATRWLLQTTVAPADQGVVRYRFYEGALGDTTLLLADTNVYYYRVFPASRPRSYWVAVYYPNTGCSTNRAVTIN